MVLNVLTFSQEGFFAFVTVHVLVVLKYLSAFLLQLREWLSGALINTCIPSSRYEISYSSDFMKGERTMNIEDKHFQQQRTRIKRLYALEYSQVALQCTHFTPSIKLLNQDNEH